MGAEQYSLIRALKLTAMESIVLLENQNGTLPMDLSKYKSVAIIGPCADDPTCARGIRTLHYDTVFLILKNFAIGDYDPAPKYIITVKAAFANKTKLTVNEI